MKRINVGKERERARNITPEVEECTSTRRDRCMTRSGNKRRLIGLPKPFFAVVNKGNPSRPLCPFFFVLEPVSR